MIALATGMKGLIMIIIANVTCTMTVESPITHMKGQEIETVSMILIAGEGLAIEAIAI